MQALLNKSGLRFFVRFSFAAGGEIMSTKPEWLRILEEKHSTRLIKNNQASEIAMSHKEILDTKLPEVWRKVKQSICDTVNQAEFPGFTLTAVTDNKIIRVSIFKEVEGVQNYCHIAFTPEHYKFEVIAENQRTKLVTLFVIVRGGRLALSNGSEVLPDNGIDGLVAAICQGLLEPVLKLYLSEPA